MVEETFSHALDAGINRLNIMEFPSVSQKSYGYTYGIMVLSVADDIGVYHEFFILKLYLRNIWGLDKYWQEQMDANHRIFNNPVYYLTYPVNNIP